MSPPSLHTLAKVPSGGGLDDALADALSGKPFNDVTFYTARSEDGGEPHAVHANSRILISASKYFRELLAKKNDDNEVDAAPSVSEAPVMPSGGARDEDDSMLGDSDDIDALESVLAAPSEVSFGDDEKVELPDSPPENTKSAATTVAAAAGTRVITLDNVAADTLEAAIFYIYTGNVAFLPLRSSISDEAQENHAKEHPNKPACSCKAAYRFADEAGLDELMQLAEAHLFAQLNSENILDEVFSPFSSQYPTILRKQVDILLEQHRTLATRAALAPIVARLVRGEMPHAARALTVLLDNIPTAQSESPARASAVPPASGLSTPEPATHDAALVAQSMFGKVGEDVASGEARATTTFGPGVTFGFGFRTASDASGSGLFTTKPHASPTDGTASAAQSISGQVSTAVSSAAGATTTFGQGATFGFASRATPNELRQGAGEQPQDTSQASASFYFGKPTASAHAAEGGTRSQTPMPAVRKSGFAFGSPTDGARSGQEARAALGTGSTGSGQRSAAERVERSDGALSQRSAQPQGLSGGFGTPSAGKGASGRGVSG
ncbi:hypothetical protein PsYK624_164930 [Phanerochaete sordida]|uniref:BTB domain-containing protein n=1 Tax=Phanerochaete sordida TaxID=48140 RepID=A0A9P3LNL6_9APHY|nr:hypothetical protein PsYK624_164930 [Phanerochaete sordida]